MLSDLARRVLLRNSTVQPCRMLSTNNHAATGTSLLGADYSCHAAGLCTIHTGQAGRSILMCSRMCDSSSHVWQMHARLPGATVCLCSGALSPRTLLAIGTKLSDRDVQAITGFMGRQLQELHLGTSILEGLSCLR